MSRILTFKVFESEEILRKGFKYSESYIEDRIYYLTDIGFKLSDDIKSMYLDNNGQNTKLIKAKKAVYFLKFKKELNKKLKYKSISSGWNNSKTYYFLDNSNDLLEISEEIASFSNHFDEVYHSINYNSDNIELLFYIYSEIGDEVIQSERELIISSESKAKISNKIYNFKRKFTDTKIGLTKKFKDEARKDKLNNSITGFIGSNNFMIMPFNLEGLTRSVINTNFRRINSILKDKNWYFRDYGDVEFKELKEDDIKELFNNLDKADLNDLKEKYLGLNAIVLKIDYERWLNDIKKDVDENFDDYINNHYYILNRS